MWSRTKTIRDNLRVNQIEREMRQVEINDTIRKLISKRNNYSRSKGLTVDMEKSDRFCRSINKQIIQLSKSIRRL